MDADQVPAEIVEKARRVLMVHGPSQGAEPHPIETDHPETAGWVEGWREAWTAVPDILAAVLPEVQARALEGAADSIQAETCAGNFNPDVCKTCQVVRDLRESAAAMRAYATGVGL